MASQNPSPDEALSAMGRLMKRNNQRHQGIIDAIDGIPSTNLSATRQDTVDANTVSNYRTNETRRLMGEVQALDIDPRSKNAILNIVGTVHLQMNAAFRALGQFSDVPSPFAKFGSTQTFNLGSKCDYAFVGDGVTVDEGVLCAIDFGDYRKVLFVQKPIRVAVLVSDPPDLLSRAIAAFGTISCACDECGDAANLGTVEIETTLNGETKIGATFLCSRHLVENHVALTFGAQVFF